MIRNGHPVARLFFFYLAACFFAASLGFLALASLMGKIGAFGSLYRMPRYHELHPFQYIGLVSLVYGFCATFGAVLWHRTRGWRRILAVTVILATSIAGSCLPGGLLWTLHDMSAGYFPKGARFWNNLLDGAGMGLKYGWLVLAGAIPYNLCGLIAGYVVTTHGFRLYGRWSRFSAPPPAEAG